MQPIADDRQPDKHTDSRDDGVAFSTGAAKPMAPKISAAANALQQSFSRTMPLRAMDFFLDEDLDRCRRLIAAFKQRPAQPVVYSALGRSHQNLV